MDRVRVEGAAARALRDALTVETRTPEAKLVWLLRASLLGLAIGALLVDPIYTTRPLLVSSAAWGFVVSFVFAFVPTRRPRTLKAAEAATLAALALHVSGHTFGWYAAFAWYDTALHFAVPLVTVLILYAFSQATRWLWDWRSIGAFTVAVHLFAMSVALGTLWEVVEFGMDTFFGTREQDDLPDTMIDLVMDVAGALLGATLVGLATRHGRRRGFDRISEPPKRPYPMRAPRGAAKE